MSTILTVFLKEVKENAREKRTLINALLFGPLFGPVFFVMLMNVMITRELDKAEQPLKVPVVGAQYAPNLIAALEQGGLQPQPALADPEGAVRARDADLVLRIASNYGKAWRKGEPAQVEIIYDSSHRDANTPVERLKKLVQAYSQRQGAMRLVARGLSPAIAVPVVVAERDQSTPQSRAGLLFSMMPYFFVFTVFIGGMYLAIDLTAGERERQSLEPLFANPVPRWKILAGKIGAICAFSITGLLLSVIAFAIAGQFVPTEKLGMAMSLGGEFAASVFVLMLPLVALLAVLQTLVAAFAKSYREAQTYLSILMFVPALPSMVLSIMPVKTAAWMYAVPLLAQQVGITELLRGGSVAPAQMATCLASGFAVALLVGWVTARIYRSERLAISA